MEHEERQLSNSMRDRIMEATMDVVYEKKISGTSLRGIANEAGILPSNIQYYFRTRKELFVSLLTSVLSEIRAGRKEMLDQCGDTLADKLNVFFRQKRETISHKKKYEAIQVDFWVQGLADEDIHAYFRSSYEGWRRDIQAILEERCPDLDPVRKQYIPYLMVSMMLGAAMQYYIEDSMDLDPYFSTCLEAVLRTIEDTPGNTGNAPVA